MGSRRNFLFSAAAATLMLPIVPKSALAQDFEPLDEIPPLPEDLMSLANDEPMNAEFLDSRDPQGTAFPSDEELNVAFEIIARAPARVRPVDVAAFFLAVSRGDYGEDWRPYTRAWPKTARANPLILSFFSRTQTDPAGDVTAWCAAFMNWCLVHAHGEAFPPHFSPPTYSAGSGSFRDWGTQSTTYDAATSQLAGNYTPRLGDIAVFQKMKDGEPHNWQGHVGFFLGFSNGLVEVLGGNQFEGRPVVHAINVKQFRPDGANLQLHSIRSDRCLHETL